MTSVAPAPIDNNFQGEAPSATEKVIASRLDSQFTATKNKVNELLLALAVSIRDDNTLIDQIVRLRNLHPEVSAVLGSSAGWQAKVAVACASVANLTLSGEQTIDGVLTSASRILVKDQTTQSQNGIYVTGAGAWTRATDADTATELGYAAVAVLGGLQNTGTTWILTQAGTAITLGTTSLVWAQWSSRTWRPDVSSVANLKLLDTAGLSSGMAVRVLGYYAAGDGGGGVFRWNGGDVTADNLGTVIAPTAGGAGRWLRVIDDGVFNIRHFGAKGDAVADDTAPVQNALTAAATAAAADYWGNFYPTVYAPPGHYITQPLTMTKPIRFFGGGSRVTGFTIKSGSTASWLTVTPIPQTDPSQQSDLSQCEIAGFSLNGNSGVVTGTSHGINFPDTGWTLATRYSVSGRMFDLKINSCKTAGIYIGVNRNFFYMREVVVRYSGSDGVQCYGYDGRVIACDFGNNTLGGWNQIAGGQVWFDSPAIYFNGSYGLILSSFTNAPVLVKGGSFDFNNGGVYVNGGSADVSHAILGARFQGNSNTTTNVTPDVQVNNCPNGVVVSGCQFIKGAKQAKYLAEIDATSFVFWNGNQHATVPANVPWGTAMSNRLGSLILEGHPLAYDSHAAGQNSISRIINSVEVERSEQLKKTMFVDQRIENTGPALYMKETSAAADCKTWKRVVTSQHIKEGVTDDAETTFAAWLDVVRGGASITSVSLGGLQGAEALKILNVGSQVNRVEVTGSATGSNPQVAAAGSDANLDLLLAGKGTGRVRFGTFSANADAPVTGYVTITDAAGTARKLATIA